MEIPVIRKKNHITYCRYDYHYISIFSKVLPESSSESGVPELLSSTSLIFLGMKYFKLANLKEDLLGEKYVYKKNFRGGKIQNKYN